MRKALTHFTEFVGKTVEGVFDDIVSDCRIVTFIDGTCAAIQSERGYESDRELPELIEIDPGFGRHVDQLVEWGVMSKEDGEEFYRRQAAAERRAQITAEEFHTLNRCLDTAIAEAVSEHARITAQTESAGEVERLGHAAHELRDILNTALLAFHMLRKGTVGIGGGTGAVLGRSLMSLREVVDRTLSEVRLSTGKQRRERLSRS